MVPEQRTRTCCYQVCHMVPGNPDLLLQGVQDGARAMHADRVLHGVQAGVLPKHHPGVEVRAAASAVHGDPLRAALRVQAGSGVRVLPQLRLWWLRQRWRLRRRLRW